MSVLYDFSGKVALITGSSSGLGAATAILFAKSGAQVVVTGRNVENIQSVAKQCLEVSPKKLRALEVVADITINAEVERIIKTVINSFGRLDILVNSVGIVGILPIYDPDYIETYRNVMKANLNSTVFLTHKCVEHLEKSNGNVVNISSVGSILSMPRFSAYCMAKSALNVFTKCIAGDLGPKGIRVNSVNPGLTRTELAHKTISLPREQVDGILKTLSGKYPLGRLADPGEIANAVLFLASDHASFVTGSILNVDGGHVAASVNVEEYMTDKKVIDA